MVRARTPRAPAYGIGSTLAFDFDQPVELVEVTVIIGYDKADPVDGRDRWQENRRVLALRLTADDGSSVDIDLADDRRPQTVTTPDLGPTSTVTLEVRRTTGHGGRDFAALSEVGFAGR